MHGFPFGIWCPAGSSPIRANSHVRLVPERKSLIHKIHVRSTQRCLKEYFSTVYGISVKKKKVKKSQHTLYFSDFIYKTPQQHYV